MKLVVSVGGSVLAPDLAPDRVAAYGDALSALAADHEVGVVVGGGRVAREYIDAARDLGGNEIELDQLGIGVTRLNARLLGAAMDGPVKPPEEYDAAAEALRRDGLVLMGGVAPGQTTDAVAAALAEYVEADLLVYATSVPGVFDADPNEDPGAERYDRLPAADLVELVAAGGSLGSAGSNAPIDLLAAKLVQRSGVRTLVLDGSDPERVRQAVADGTFDGTEIVPDGDGEVEA
jgi:uridylate kinase